jgi:hypothetical protein
MKPILPLALAALFAGLAAQAADAPAQPKPRDICLALLNGALAASGIEQVCQLPQRTLSSQLQQGFALLGCQKQVPEQEGLQLSKRVAADLNAQASQQGRQTFCAQKQPVYQHTQRQFAPLLEQARQTQSPPR